MAEQEFTDAIMLLRGDHETVKMLFEEYQDSDDTKRKCTIAGMICDELKIHAMIEEEIFYPAFRGKIEDDMLDEAVVEHDGAKVLINDIAAHEPDEEYYDAKITVLCEQIEHHVEEEEMPHEGMFAKCRDTDVDLKALLEPMLARKQELKEQAESSGLPPAQLSAVSPEAA